MTTVSARQSPPWDSYRFGDGPQPELQPGTLGWSDEDLKEPWVRRLWDAGRFEIINGVLTRMPAAYFRGGKVVLRLATILDAYFISRKVPAEPAVEVDIRIDANRLVRADAAWVIGDDLTKFASLKFDPPDTTWQDHPLTLPPTLLIESVSQGHEPHDRRTKRSWYAEFGVPNYWIVDAYQRTLECLVLNAGQYQTDQSGRDSDRLTPAAFAGLTISLADVWGRQ